MAELPPSWSRGVVVPVQFRAGHSIFHEGDRAGAVYCVKSGMVKLYKSGRAGEPLIIRLLGPGHLIGYRAVLSGESFAATAEAVTDSVLCRIPDGLFLELLDTSRAFARNLARYIAKELRISEERLLAAAQLTVAERTIWLLDLFLAEHSESGRSAAPLQLPLLRAEIAQMIGTTPETLSRVLHRLADAGLIVLTGRRISVPDPALLRLRARVIYDGPAIACEPPAAGKPRRTGDD